MMKKMLIAAGLMLVCAFVWSQNDSLVVVWECQGKVKYTPPDGSKGFKLTDGMLVSKNGMVKLKKKASLQLLDDMKVITLNEAGEFNIGKMLEETSAPEIRGMGGDFFAMVNTSLVSNPPPTSSDGKKGMGGKSGKSIFPVKGKVTPQMITFEWLSDDPQVTKWTFQILQPNMLAPVVSLETMETATRQNLASSDFEVGQEYTWQVNVADNPSQEVAQYEFTLASSDEEKAIMSKLTGDAAYQSAGVVQKLLMEANAFEAAGFIYHANELYNKAWQVEPKNLLIQKLYYSFWLRQL